ncbi:MAG TPA: hypothetical protein PKY82_06120 [Pyrinomonadaceae bacterium]|nr:hypothetical protein [Pyrinomonadaceae bacterium]
MSIPAVTSSPAFTCYANPIEADGGGDPSDNGGSKPVEAPKGGSTLDKIVDTVKTVLGGLISGTGSSGSGSSC